MSEINCISREISEIKSSLKWSISEDRSDVEVPQLSSDINNKRHCIHMPKEKGPFYYIELLHEYVHALHYEKLPLEFSQLNIDKDMPFGIDIEIKQYSYVTSDWFVAGYIASKCRDEYAMYIEHEYNEINNKLQSARDDKDIMIAGLTCAEAQYWLGYSPFSHSKVIDVCNALLKVSPGEPTVENNRILLEHLFNIFRKFKFKKNDNLIIRYYENEATGAF